MDGNGSYRITIGLLYTQQQEISTRLGALNTTVQLMDSRMNSVLEENKALRSRLEKVEGRLNGVFVGLGTGVIVGAIAFLRGFTG